MARRNDHSREEIHGMALEAAEDIACNHGYSAISARKVASAIGYTVGTLYLVFDNLNDLVLQVNGRTLDRLHDQMVRDQEVLDDPLERLLQLGYTYIRFSEEDPHCWEMVFEHRMPNGEATPEWFREKVARMFLLVESALQPLAGQHSPGEVSLAARALWSGVHGVCILANTHKLDSAGVNSVRDLSHSLMSNYIKGFTGT